MNDQLVRDLREDIQSRQPEMVAFLEALVRAESPSVVPESQSGIQALLAGSLRDDGFRVRMIGGRGQSGGLLQASPRVRRRRIALPAPDRPHRHGLAAGHALADAAGDRGRNARGPRGVRHERGAGAACLRAQVAPRPGGRAWRSRRWSCSIPTRRSAAVSQAVDPPLRTPRRSLLRARAGSRPGRKAEDRAEGGRPVRDPDRGAKCPCGPRSHRGRQCHPRAFVRDPDAPGAERSRGRNLGQRGPDRRRRQAQRGGSLEQGRGGRSGSDPGRRRSGSKRQSTACGPPCRGPGSSSRGPWTSRRWSRPGATGGSGRPRARPVSDSGSNSRRRVAGGVSDGNTDQPVHGHARRPGGGWRRGPRRLRVPGLPQADRAMHPAGLAPDASSLTLRDGARRGRGADAAPVIDIQSLAASS